MKCTIPEISWHNRDPVLSVDIQPFLENEVYRLASGGSDCHVLIWYLKIKDNGGVDLVIASDLNKHQRAVNVVRWSSSGKYLATGDDDANIIIWNLKTDNIPLLEGESTDKETWIVTKTLRGHREDVYDICWAPNELNLISGSIDNTAILWDFNKGTMDYIINSHKGFVQGVTWDPKGELLATLCSDRECRILDKTGKRIIGKIHKGILPVSNSNILFNKELKYFHDDTFKSYFRRLTFSPDGNLLITPSGLIDVEDYQGPRNATFIFTLDNLLKPAAVLPSKQITIAVRCCPLLFQLHTDVTEPIIKLPYRMILAVATDCDIILYDTQQLTPFAYFQKIHYTRITDISWSSDGLLLIASSTDGFCTLITFEPNELGITYIKADSEPELELEDLPNNLEKSVGESTETKIKKPTILEQWTTTISSKINAAETSKEKPTITKLVPRRIAPTKIEDTKDKPKEVKHIIENEVVVINDDENCPEKKPKNINVLTPKSTKKKSKLNADVKNSLLNFVQVTPKKQLKLDSDVIPVIEILSDSPENSANTENKEKPADNSDKDQVKSVSPQRENCKSKDKIENSDEISLDSSTSKINTSRPKMGRRVPLITLSSSKSKKKNDTNLKNNKITKLKPIFF